MRGHRAVVHLAVLPLNLANADPAQAFETNVRGSFNVFDAAGKAGVARVVYSSASSAYGPTDAYPIVEDHPLRPNAFYPASKAAAEMLLRGLAGSYGYGFIVLRYMNVYGPGQTAGRRSRGGARAARRRAPQAHRRRHAGVRLRAHRGLRAGQHALDRRRLIGRGAQRRLGRGDLAQRARRDTRQTCSADRSSPSTTGRSTPHRLASARSSAPRELIGYRPQVCAARRPRDVLDALQKAAPAG